MWQNLKLIADTPAKRKAGLAAIPKLVGNEFALFIMPKESSPKFWNKGVDYKIKVIFLDSDFKVIVERVLNPNQLEPVGTESNKVKYVIEKLANKESV